MVKSMAQHLLTSGRIKVCIEVDYQRICDKGILFLKHYIFLCNNHNYSFFNTITIYSSRTCSHDISFLKQLRFLRESLRQFWVDSFYV